MKTTVRPKLSENLLDLTGKTALVTGGSRGIGAACAILLARAGANVAITYAENAGAAQKVRQRIETLGRSCMTVRCRASRATDVRRAIQAVSARLGAIDILVNNAGIWKKGVIGSMTESQWDETLDVNLKGIFLFTNGVVPSMKRRRRGKIINIASTAGQRGEPFYSHYAASKGGVIAFTKSIGSELARWNINANCVSPGWVDTDMTSDVLRAPSTAAEIRRVIPRGRVATPEEIAGAVLFLASDLSNHMIGATISVNGGSVLHG